MSFMVATLRRSLWLLLIGAVGGVAWSWWSDRNAPPSPSSPPEWPPLDDHADVSARADGAEATPPSMAAAPPITSEVATAEIPTAAADTPPLASASPPAASGSGSTSFVNALVDAPDARSGAGTGGWVEPDEDGSCPLSHPVKANDNSGIFHVPGGRFYERTNAERCYSTAEAAVADGYRQAKA